MKILELTIETHHNCHHHQNHRYLSVRFYTPESGVLTKANIIISSTRWWYEHEHTSGMKKPAENWIVNDYCSAMCVCALFRSIVNPRSIFLMIEIKRRHQRLLHRSIDFFSSFLLVQSGSRLGMNKKKHF